MSMKPVLDWDNEQVLADIRAMGDHPKLTKTEFNTFINTCRSMNLNPFTKEIYCLKNGSTMQIIVARDGYRKVAQREAEYDYHQTDAVYSNDKFKVMHGEVEHEYVLTDRGQLIGAYCTVKRKSSTKSMYAYVEFKEYDLKRSIWTSKPATMIKKVAEAHALRMAFQAVFVGTYDADELPEEMTKSQNENNKPDTSEVITEASKINPDQVAKIDDLMMLGDISYERLQSGMRLYFKKAELQDLTEQEASELIERLEKKVQNEITKEKDIDMEVKATDEQTKQGADSEEIRATGDAAHNNNN